MAERIAQLDADIFLSGPAEFLAKNIAEQTKLVPQFQAVFGPAIDSYLRMDYSMRDLPALRIYNTSYGKDFDSWFVTGDLTFDIILPASTRRKLLSQYQDTLTSALCSQLRRPSFFAAMCNLIPGLNELGKEFHADKTMGFKFGDTLVPATQIVTNFRLDLREWDNFLMSDNRTKDDPFEKTLEDLTMIHTVIKAQDDNENEVLQIISDQSIG